MLDNYCKKCNNEVLGNFYFYDTEIITENDYCANRVHYIAYTKGRAICPCCGTIIEKVFSKTIDNSDIINLAGGRKE